MNDGEGQIFHSDFHFVYYCLAIVNNIECIVYDNHSKHESVPYNQSVQSISNNPLDNL